MTMEMIDIGSKVTGKGYEHQATFRSEFPGNGMVALLTISRDEPDCDDNERYGICSGVLNVEEIATGKRLHSVEMPQRWEIYSSIYDYMVEAARAGDFDELVETAVNQQKNSNEKRMKPGEWGSKDGKPAIVWWRYGEAVKGEPSVVTEARTYETEADRYAAYVAARHPESEHVEKPIQSRELAFTIGTGNGWNCHTDDGFGFHIAPVGGGKAWDWGATRSWMDGVGTGQEVSRDDAVASAKQCLVDAGLNLDRLPVQKPNAIKFEFDEAQFTLEALLEANAHDEALCKWARNANIGDSFDGCTRVPDGPVSVSSQDANPALQWFTMEQAKPPEQKNVVAMLDSGIPILGRNIAGRFATLDPVNDRFVEQMEGQENGFHGIKCWAEVIDPGKPENDLNSRILLAETLRYIDAPEQVDVDWLVASIQRHQNGLTLCEQRNNAVSVAPTTQPVSGAVLVFPGMPEPEIDELVETLKRGGNTLFRLPDDMAGPVLRDAVAVAGLEADEFHP